ncbi:hypothetical protein GCM10007390_11640 [Persicitalea jodogahamensis]|uniref:Uncharacterized protein n=1 Tax=Persicitalea jodogahamensis TaxID=402147 RepID=A0A8J3D0R6_9BACT|nr:hypothetical protein GCM10007390_11640 [Persicitalea jodogahamensis]
MTADFFLYLKAQLFELGSHAGCAFLFLQGKLRILVKVLVQGIQFRVVLRGEGFNLLDELVTLGKGKICYKDKGAE